MELPIATFFFKNLLFNRLQSSFLFLDTHLTFSDYQKGKALPFTGYTVYKANASHSMSSATTPGNAVFCPKYSPQKQNRRNESASESGGFPSPFPIPSGQ